MDLDARKADVGLVEQLGSPLILRSEGLAGRALLRVEFDQEERELGDCVFEGSLVEFQDSSVNEYKKHNLN